LLLLALTSCAVKRSGKFTIVIPLTCVTSESLVLKDCKDQQMATPTCRKITFTMRPGCEQIHLEGGDVPQH